jgi:hypothetical protein
VASAIVHLHLLKPHCIQSSRVLVPTGTSKSTLRRHGIQAAVTLWRCLQQCVLTGLNWLRVHWRHQPWNGCIEYSVALTATYVPYTRQISRFLCFQFTIYI